MNRSTDKIKIWMDNRQKYYIYIKFEGDDYCYVREFSQEVLKYLGVKGHDIYIYIYITYPQTIQEKNVFTEQGRDRSVSKMIKEVRVKCHRQIKVFSVLFLFVTLCILENLFLSFKKSSSKMAKKRAIILKTGNCFSHSKQQWQVR